MTEQEHTKQVAYQLAFLLVSALLCTWLRVSLLFLYPAAVLFLFFICSWKLGRPGLYVLTAVMICWLLSFRHGFYWKYNLVSFYYFIPFVALLFARPPHERRPILRMLMDSLTFVAIVNDCVGVVQYIKAPNDDSFRGIYGAFTVSQNGLSIINALLFFYYLTRFQFQRGRLNLVLSIFFLLACMMGFYGAGLIVLIVSVLTAYLRMNRKQILRIAMAGAVLGAFLFFSMKLVSPKTLEYNIAIVKLFLDPASPRAPRKLTIFRNYAASYPHHPADLLFGSGPGTFNSRSAFMVGSPTYFSFTPIKSLQQPPYFRDYAYPLWNASNTGPFDGFMNQPFSSLLSLLGEYGLLITGCIILLLGWRFWQLNRSSAILPAGSPIHSDRLLYRFCCAYLAMLILIDNYMEYPEVIVLLIVVIKLSRGRLQAELAELRSNL